ncbi:NAD(P)H-hydrate dehydratase [Roseateles sp. BYS87W]|uniref:Bifunctional NAD(P)H-hydrate repair enzyme n=1 Tax=Pelomonas baiyunensis TaxID=3299026 RepID=A0ABW7GVF6_9BURK
MRPLLPTTRPWPLFDTAATRRIEVAALAATPDLMARAGHAVAKLALALRRGDGPVWLACGRGNNGGDGRIAADVLAAHGIPTHAALQPPASPPSLVVDALFGIGLNRPLDAASAAVIEAMNACSAPILAVDVPSGLLADTGQPAGTIAGLAADGVAVRATHTLSLLTLKPGLFTGEGRALAGRIWFDHLGVTPAEAPTAWLSAPQALPASLASHHKGSHGQVLVVGGAAGMQGAARLAARAALHAGAGRVYVDLLAPNDGGPADAGQPELMCGSLAECPLAVGVIGCGGGPEIAARLPALLSALPRAVLDADALNAIAASAPLQAAVASRAPGTTVITPHPLEAARLLQITVQAVQQDRLAAAQTLARQLRCTVLLKGSGSVIASPGETPTVISTGGPALGTAGSGDVLAGWLGGWCARHAAMPLHTLACAAAHAHGAAGEVNHVLPAGELIAPMTRLL